MPSRFDRYRVKDGVTPLGERFFNPVFQDMDLRLAGLEELRLSWEAAVRAVSEFGLLRINEVIGPALDAVSGNVSEIAQKRDAAVAAIEALEETIAGITGDADAGIAEWKEARLADLDAWQASLTSALPGIGSRLDALDAALDAALPGIGSRLDALDVAVATKANSTAIADKPSLDDVWAIALAI